jgi:hypothetical protein
MVSRGSIDGKKRYIVGLSQFGLLQLNSYDVVVTAIVMRGCWRENRQMVEREGEASTGCVGGENISLKRSMMVCLS